MCRELGKSLVPHDFGAMDIDQFGIGAVHARLVSGRTTINPMAGTPLRYPVELPRRDIDLLDIIGSGEHGVVHRAQLRNSGMFVPFEFDVAVKVLKDDASDEMTEALLRECGYVSACIWLTLSGCCRFVCLHVSGLSSLCVASLCVCMHAGLNCLSDVSIFAVGCVTPFCDGLGMVCWSVWLSVCVCWFYLAVC